MSNPSIQPFADESGAEKNKGSILGFIRNGQGADRQFDWFVPDKANGLVRAGLSRLNQSIKVFLYCIIGAQVNVRSSILGDGGRAIEAQSEILTLLEDAIRQPNMNLWLNNDVNKGTKKVGLRLMVEVLPKLTRQTITHLVPFTRRQ